MKNALIAIIIIVLLAALGFGGWYLFLKKSPEGGTCLTDNRCEQGLKCVSKTCSSGKVGSVCVVHKDCQLGLLCATNVCKVQPDYSKYFSGIIIGKIRLGEPFGPNNSTVQTTEFKKTDALEVDLAVKSSDVNGEFYYDLVNATNGKVAMSGAGNKQKIEGQSRGTGSDLPVPVGSYDLNLYFNNELIYTTPITVSS
jgi:hypothetical protein